MKYCEECKINMNRELMHCPLCGAHLEKEGEGYAKYSEQTEPRVCYPKVRGERLSFSDFLRRKATWLCLAVIVMAVIINLVVSPGFYWSAYVAIGVIIVYACVIVPVYKKARLYAIIGMMIVIVPLGVFGIDITATYALHGNMDGFGISLFYVTPLYTIAILILCDVLAFIDRSEYQYYLVTMWLVTFVSLLPQPIIWIFKIEANFPIKDILTMTLFFFALVNGIVMSIIFWKKVKRELIRKFFI